MIQNAVKTRQTNSLASLAKRCRTVNQLKQLHAHILKLYSDEDPIAVGPLISVAATSGDASFFSYAHLIFNRFRCRNTFMYNTMIRGNAQLNSPVGAVLCYLDMLRSGVDVNNYTFPPLIKACIALGPNLISVGHLVHAHVAKFGFFHDLFVVSALIEFYGAVCGDLGTARKLFDRNPERDVVMWTALIDGYGKAGEVEEARKLFDEMPQRNVVSWSAIMAAYSRASDFKEVLSLFEQMQKSRIEPNESILVTVLTACAHLGAVTQGTWVHSYAKRLGFEHNPVLATALVEMYSKCGFLELAHSVFERIPDSLRDSGAWNAMISGVALSGDARRSIELFYKMVETHEARPTETTFVVLLTACTHSGLVNQGLRLFEEMGPVYGIEPRSEHSACIVDLLARSGLVVEAEKFVEEKMGGVEGKDANVWGALLSSCRVYGNVELGNRVWKRLTAMGIEDCGTRVLSYNMYRESGWENEAVRVRKSISDTRMRKKPGCSVVELDGCVKEFMVGDLCEELPEEMYKVLDSLPPLMNSEEFTGIV